MSKLITGTDLNLTESFINKVADSPEQAEAVKKVLGVTEEANKLIEANTPERAPWIPPVFDIDQSAHISEWVEQCRASVESFPDEDPTPLRDRQRALLFAERNLAEVKADANANRESE